MPYKYQLLYQNISEINQIQQKQVQLNFVYEVCDSINSSYKPSVSTDEMIHEVQSQLSSVL